jgi:aldehyde:ferredoxin oxidoreductase
MFGFYGRVLTVNLTDESFEIETLLREICEQVFGGKGLATHLLLTKNPAGVNPLSAENHLIFATGPVCQSSLWGSSRYGVFTKSPLTGFYSESYSGGKVPEAMDAAGFDAVVIRGKAKRPTVLSVHPEGCGFFDAGDLWGMETYQTEEEAKRRFSIQKPGFRKPGAVVIGPAGEKLVRFAVIENDKWRSAGRTGVGTVMGSKLVKAIVFQGDRRRPLADPEGVGAYVKEFSKRNLDHPAPKMYRALGTTMVLKMTQRVNALPSKYWSQGSVEHWEKISGERLHQDHQVKPSACLKCFLACGRMTTISSGRHKGLVIEGPEYETLYAFGALCMIEDLGEIAYLNDLCDRLGLDTISAGNLCSFAMEAAARKKIDYPIAYGDAEGTAELLRKIARREEIGEVLAEGIVHASKAWGLEDIAVHVKGLEPAGYDPRTLKGMGLSYATSDRGACHLRTTFFRPELAGLIAPETIKGKAAMLIDYEDRLNLFDSLVLCRFYRDLYPWEEMGKVLQLLTGNSLTKEELQRTASRIADMTRTFNIREGLKPEHDRLPQRLHKEPLPSGQQLTEEELQSMIQDYYRLRGWDQNGVPVGR